MAYLMVETSVRTHRKFLAAGPAACWLWLCGLGYCQDGLTDGRIPESAIDFLGVKDPSTLVAKLLEAGLWETVDGGYQMHDYFDHNKSADQVRDIMRRRAKGGKKGGRPRNNLKGSPQNNLQGSDGAQDIDNLDENPVRPVRPLRPVRPAQPTETEGASPRDGTPAKVAFDGARLRVWHWQHEDLGKRLGAKASEFDLLTWYERLDKELAESGDSYGDPWAFLRERLYRDADLPLPNLMGRVVRRVGPGVTGAIPEQKRADYDDGVHRAVKANV